MMDRKYSWCETCREYIPLNRYEVWDEILRAYRPTTTPEHEHFKEV